MKRTTTLRWTIACCIVGAVLCGCGKVDLKLQMKPGDVRVVNVTTEMTASQDGAGGPIQSLRTSRYETTDVDPAGNVSLKVTFERGDLPQFGGMGKIAELMPGLEDLKLDGKSFTAVVGPKGTVSNVRGMDATAREVADKLLAVFQKEMAESKDIPAPLKAQLSVAMREIELMMRKMIRQQLGDGAMRDQLVGVFSMYPETPVRKGAEWTKSYAVEAPVPMSVAENWKLVERANGIAKLGFTSAVTSNPNAPMMEVMGTKVTVTVNGQVTGTAEVEEATGWPRTVLSDLDLNVDTNFMGMSMSQNLKGTQRWETTP